MQLPDQFTIEGTPHARDDLLTTASAIKADPSQPQWRQELFAFIHDFLTPGVDLIQSTSGTTGDPKHLKLDRAAMVHSAKMTLKLFQLAPGQSALLCLPVHYIAGKMMVVRALVGKLNLIPVEPGSDPLQGFDPTVDFAAMVPLQLYESLQTPHKLAQIGTLIIGGGEISSTLRSKLKNIPTTELFETFAMTETYSHFAIRKLNGPSEDDLFHSMDEVVLKTDQRGCLIVDLPNITRGPVETNDLVELWENSSFRWLGRYDNQISTGGIKVIPELVEKQIRHLIDVEYVIVGLPDAKYGSRLVLVLEAAEGTGMDPQLTEWMAANLNSYEVPKEILWLDKFPRNTSMKVLRRKIPALLASN